MKININHKYISSDIPEIIFTYGYTASGKTTWCQNFLNNSVAYTGKNFLYISADEIRKELYGSQDSYGDSEKIYNIILERMLEAIKNNKSILYDACNIRYDYRMDYLKHLNKYDNYYKTIVRINTDIITCFKNHKERGRNFSFNQDQEKLTTYPTLAEGWDNIEDVSYSPSAYKFYIASPFFEDIHRKRAYRVAEFLRAKNNIVFLPCEHKVPNAWGLPNYQWGQKVFEADVEALKNSDFLVCLSYGREGSAGTAWELGYSYEKMYSLVVEMPETKIMSLMMSNGCSSVIRFDELWGFDFNNFERRIDKTMEQK